MQIILLSGGSGKRLWPLSSAVQSKQFLKLLPGEDGLCESMVQRVVRQIKTAGLAEKVLVATAAAQADILKEQLGDIVEIVAEPCRRDTFPAIALSCMYLRTVKKCSRDEAVVVMPCDPFTEQGYFKTVTEMVNALEDKDVDMALMGIAPSCPSTKFGYIVPQKPFQTPTSQSVCKVKQFTEKPNEDRAIELLRQGALWNGGVFAFRLGYIEDIVDKYCPNATFEELLTRYEELPKISFDYEVVEKAQGVVVVSYDGLWEDLGTWNSFSRRMSSATVGRVLLGDGCENTNVVNYLSQPVFVNGVKNVVVVACENGILVCDKNECETLKENVEKIETI